MERKPYKKKEGDHLTHARLAWLEHCSTMPGVTAMELRIAMQLSLIFAGMPKSREKFELSGIPIAWPPQTMLAKHLQCSRQAISQATRRLAKRGLLEITPGVGRGNATEYALVRKRNSAGGGLIRKKPQAPINEKATAEHNKGNAKSQVKASKPIAPFLSSQSKYQSHSYSQNNDLSFSGAGGRKRLPEFEAVFEMWPHQDKDHSKAMGAWINHVVKPGHDPDLVLKRARKWCRHWIENKVTHRPYLGLWLRDRMWQDAPEDAEADRYHDYVLRDEAKQRRSPGIPDYDILDCELI